MEPVATPASLTSGSASMQTSPAVSGMESTAVSNELQDDDDISLTSTLDSEPQEEYEVDTIHAEERLHGVSHYLVKWKGYSDLRCTWEPVSSFNSDECLKDWKKRQQAIKQGLEPPFDVQAWEAMIEASEDARDERKRRRKEKRARLGLPPSKNDEQKSTPSGAKETNPALPLPGESNTPRELHKSSHQPKKVGPAPRRSFTSTTTPRPIERPRIPAPKPVAITMTDDRTKRRSLPDLLHRSKGQQKSSADAIKTSKLFSVTHKFDKASRTDHEPIQDQLELQKPGEWTPFQMSSYLRKKQTTTDDSLFVEQEEDDENDDMNINSPLAPLFNNTSLERSPPSWTDVPSERQTSRRTSPPLFNPPRAPRFFNSPKKPFRINNRELGKKTDLLCRLFYGSDEVDVGEVCLCNVSDSYRTTIYKTKKWGDIDLLFDEFCTLDNYHAITNEVNSSYDK